MLIFSVIQSGEGAMSEDEGEEEEGSDFGDDNESFADVDELDGTEHATECAIPCYSLLF